MSFDVLYPSHCTLAAGLFAGVTAFFIFLNSRGR